MIFKAEVEWFEEVKHYDTGLVAADSYVGAMEKVADYYGDTLIQVTLREVADDVAMFTEDTFDGAAGAECVNNLVEKWKAM